MPETPRKLKVFLCHSSNDKPAVRELYQKLSAESWLDPWLDEEKLFPGQDWNLEIEKAVEAADAILVCLSNNSITKEGYVQRELRIVLDYADYKPEGTLYLIPVRLEACEPPRRLRPWQYADYFPPERRDWAFGRLMVSLKMRAESLGVKTVQPVAVRIPAPVALKPPQVRQPASLPFPVRQEKPAEPSSRLTLAGIEFCHVPAGKFLMGSKDHDFGAANNEKPQHSVEIPYDYWLARFTVTNAQFEQFIQASGYKTTADEKGSAWGYENGQEWQEIKGANWQHPCGPKSGIAEKAEHPVVSVSWLDAMQYCQWFNMEFQASLLPLSLVLRLPSEAEWEKAARGMYGNFYPWGNDFDSKRCNTAENGKQDTLPVGAFPNDASPYGCEQMAGNIWEWTRSSFQKYANTLSAQRKYEHDQNEKGNHVLRGGSFRNNGQDARSASRRSILPHLRRASFGFRACLIPMLKG